MNKSIITNGLAFTLVLLGFILDNVILKTVGLFAVSVALTNWISLHILFMTIPGFYVFAVFLASSDDFTN